MPLLPSEKQIRLVLPLLLTIVTLVFAYTVKIREPWFGVLSIGHHSFNTGTTLRYTRNWYHEGIFKLNFLMVENPRSVEFPTLKSRAPYISYPSGGIVPIYVLSLLRGEEPTVGLIMGYDLANHYLLALVLLLLTFRVMCGAGYPLFATAVLSLIPPLLELLLPGPLYWHQNVFFVDQAVMLPFALYILLELLRDTEAKPERAVLVLQQLVLVWGILSDWLFVLLLVATYLKRLVNRQIGTSPKEIVVGTVRFSLMPILALVPYLYQLASQDLFGLLKERFLFRTGATNAEVQFTQNFSSLFWGQYIPEQYGAIGVWLIWGTLLFWLGLGTAWYFGKRTGLPVPARWFLLWGLSGMVLIPCFLQVYIFRNHSAIHDFSALKFSLVISLFPFVWLPLLAFELFRTKIMSWGETKGWWQHPTLRTHGEKGLLLLPVVCTLIYLGLVHAQYRSMFPDPFPAWIPLSAFIRQNVTERDIVFSPDFDVPQNPPQFLSLTMKRVYPVNSPGGLKKIGLQRLKSDFSAVIIFNKPPGPEWQQFLGRPPNISSGDFSLYRFPRRFFEEPQPTTSS
ncbi:MAG: hypothetical protein K1Y36_18510 [Blastocatellia bacterium]|nr:hypothetical protein [Blastocatellia bacterium]